MNLASSVLASMNNLFEIVIWCTLNLYTNLKSSKELAI